MAYRWNHITIRHARLNASNLTRKNQLTPGHRPPNYIGIRYIGEGQNMKTKAGRKAELKPPEDFLPLSPPVFHILLALADGEAHGYAIMQDVARRSGGSMRLGPGTLYG